MDKKWHHLTTDTVLGNLNADTKGLNADEVQKRLKKHGPNKLPEAKSRSALMRFLLQFHNVLIYVLMVAAVVTALLDHWIDTWVIVAVILINAIIGFVQEGKAEKALENIRNMLSLNANVLRDGSKKKRRCRRACTRRYCIP